MGALAYPRVSVVTAAYQDLRFLDAAVESISRQTFQDLELVLVNDGAAQCDIFTRQTARDPRVRVLTNVVNLGPMEAANRGIRDARGDIIVRLDADDISRPDRVAHLVAALDADPEIAVVGGSFVNIDEDSRQGSITRMPETDLDIRWTLLFGNPFCHSTVAFRRRCFEAAGGYDPGWQASGDHEFWFRLLNHGRSANLQEILVDYRINPRSVSATHAKNRRERTDPLRQKSWSRLGVTYESLIAAELYRFVSGFDMPDLSLRDSAYRVCLRLLRTFIGSSRPFSRASDRLNERRLVRAIVERMLSDEMTYLPSAVNSDDLAWSQSFISAPEHTTTFAQQRTEVLATPKARLSSDGGAEAANAVTQWSGGNSVPEEFRAQEASFLELGFLGPITLFTDAQCALILRHLRLGTHAPPTDWAKGRAASDRFFYDLATSPALLVQLRSLLGNNIILWGASIIEREPGRIYTWHTDIESCGGDDHFVSVWIGLKNTSRDSALQLVSRSHAIGKTIQQVVSEHGMRRGEASNETIVSWAQTYDPLATLVQPDARDGQAILFDGRLWHASNNTRSEGRRVALLLQYAAAETSDLRA